MRIASGLMVAFAAAMVVAVGQNAAHDIGTWVENNQSVVVGSPVKHYAEDDPEWCYQTGNDCKGLTINPGAELDESQVQRIEGVGELVCPTPDKNDPACVVENHPEGEK